MADFVEDLDQAGAGTTSEGGQDMGAVKGDLERISSDSDAGVTPQKNAEDINVLAFALQLVIAGFEEMAKQHAIMAMKIAKLTGEDVGMGAPAGEEAPPAPAPGSENAPL